MEIAHSTRTIALHDKLNDYQEAGVAEYLVLCIEERELIWTDFRSSKPIRPNREGISRSRVFPGLWIDCPAVLDRDTLRIIEAARQGLASPEHTRFVKRLQAAWHKRSPK